MTHSHDRTLLAGLGFNDPDKKNFEHDLACRYLSELEQREKLIELAVDPPDFDHVGQRFWRGRPCPICRTEKGSSCRQWQLKIRADQEKLEEWKKGDEQYKFERPTEEACLSG